MNIDVFFLSSETKTEYIVRVKFAYMTSTRAKTDTINQCVGGSIYLH